MMAQVCLTEPVCQFSQGMKFAVGVAAIGSRFMLAIDPCHRDAQRTRRDDIVEVALRRMQPTSAPKALASLDKMAWGRFVRAHLLRGDDQVEGHRQMTLRAGQEVVIDI